MHPTENFEPMNLLQMSCVITWAQKNQPPTSNKKRAVFFKKKKIKPGFGPPNISFEKKSFHANLKNVN